MQHQFFDQEEFFNKAPIPSMQYPMNFPDYIWNTLILYIANNWSSTRWLMYRHKEKILKQVDQFEKIKIGFLLINKINILNYEKKNNKKFIEDYFKKNMGVATPTY